MVLLEGAVAAVELTAVGLSKVKEEGRRPGGRPEDRFTGLRVIYAGLMPLRSSSDNPSRSSRRRRGSCNGELAAVLKCNGPP